MDGRFVDLAQYRRVGTDSLAAIRHLHPTVQQPPVPPTTSSVLHRSLGPSIALVAVDGLRDGSKFCHTVLGTLSSSPYLTLPWTIPSTAKLSSRSCLTTSGLPQKFFTTSYLGVLC